MEDLVKRRALGTGGKFSTLDWPTPEILASARRSRAEALRDMTVVLWRKLKSLAIRPFTSSETDTASTNTGKKFSRFLIFNWLALRAGCREHQTVSCHDPVSKVAKEALARAWLEN
jgi:hypothetical protein